MLVRGGTILDGVGQVRCGGIGCAVRQSALCWDNIFAICFPFIPGSITFDEWIGFWLNVLQHGYNQDDLEEEVEMLLEGNSWVDFNDGRNT